MAHDNSQYSSLEYTGGLPTFREKTVKSLGASEYSYGPDECPRRSPGMLARQTERTGIAERPPGLLPNDSAG